jgi:hypothetical protein
MSEDTAGEVGSIVWQDLTVADAERVRDFYEAVAGWRAEPLEGDFNMFPAGSARPAAGICFAKGANAKLPPAWLVYIRVASVEASVAQALQRGGSIIDGPRSVGAGHLCVLRDPAGAAFALYDSGPTHG